MPDKPDVEFVDTGDVEWLDTADVEFLDQEVIRTWMSRHMWFFMNDFDVMREA